MQSKNKFHSGLKINLSKKLIFKKYAKELFLEKYDLIVVALSLSGINFIGKELNNYKVKYSKLKNFLNSNTMKRL